MKVLLFGYGSIGQRHAANLRQLRPEAHLVIADPFAVLPKHDLGYRHWKDAIKEHGDADAAIVASPTVAHAEQLGYLVIARVPAYVEKPVCVPTPHTIEFPDYVREVAEVRNLSCAVGYQYRFHPTIARLGHPAHLDFHGQDDLLARYGPDVVGIMGAHPIDTALWLLGPALDVDLSSNGVAFGGRIQHERGESTYDFRMDQGPRESWVNRLPLPPSNTMYLEALAAWLTWVEGGERDHRTATLADGLRGVEVMAQVKRV